MGKTRRLFIPAGMGIRILLPTLLVVGLLCLPALLAWNETQSVQEKNTSMRDYTRSLLVADQLTASLSDEIQAKTGTNSAAPGSIDSLRQETDQRSQQILSLQQTASYDPESTWLDELADINQQTASLLAGAATHGAVADTGAVRDTLVQNDRSMADIFTKLMASLQARINEAVTSSGESSRNSTERVLFSILATGIFGVGLATLLTRRVVRPVTEISRAANELSRGNFNRRVRITGNDELGRLGSAFNRMASSLHLRTEALVQEHSKLKSIHQSITDGILVFGNNGFIVSANPAVEAILGKTEAGLAGSRRTGVAALDDLLAREQLISPDEMVPCWEQLACDHDDCPAHGSDDLRCWLQCGDFCREEYLACSSLKGDVCERCPVYQKNGCASISTDIDGRSYAISVVPILNEQARASGRLAVIHDISEEKHNSRQLALLFQIVNSIAAADSVMDSLQESLELCISAMDASSGSIMLLDEHDTLVICAQKGLNADLNQSRQQLGEGVAGWVAEHSEPLLLTKSNPDPRVPSPRNIKDAVCIPIRDKKRVLGVLSLNERKTGSGFTPKNLDFLGPVAMQMGAALSRARLRENVAAEREKSAAIVECMGESLCVRDAERTILFANAVHKEIFGEDCVGRHCHELYVDRDHICRGCPLDRCFDNGATVRRSHFVIDRLGNRRQLETTATPIRSAEGDILSCIEISRDVTEMLLVRDQAQSRLNTLTTLFEVSNTLSSSMELANILDNFATSALQAMQAQTVTLLMFSGKDRLPVISAITGKTGDWDLQVGDVIDLAPYDLNRLVSDEGPFCATTPDEMIPASMALTPPRTESVLVGRLASRGKLLGLIAVSSGRRNAFSKPGQMELFIDITNQASVAIDNAEMYKQLEATFWSTIRSLAEAIDAKDSYTRGHSDRVADYAEGLARRLKMEEDMLNAVRCAGYLHDTGKIGIPDAILLKPGKLTESEYTQIMNHPILSHKIIEPVDFPYDVKPLVRHHHERIDGSGYPDGLIGDEIPLGARIIGIADAFEAMTSDRPYRKALSFAAATEELKRGAGTQFDELLVSEFLEYLDDDLICAND
ncbi:MAG: HD domain-containing phosphohydrolase [Thermoleophilia bacterium]